MWCSQPSRQSAGQVNPRGDFDQDHHQHAPDHRYRRHRLYGDYYAVGDCDQDGSCDNDHTGGDEIGYFDQDHHQHTSGDRHERCCFQSGGDAIGDCHQDRSCGNDHTCDDDQAGHVDEQHHACQLRRLRPGRSAARCLFRPRAHTPWSGVIRSLPSRGASALRHGGDWQNSMTCRSPTR